MLINLNLIRENKVKEVSEVVGEEGDQDKDFHFRDVKNEDGPSTIQEEGPVSNDNGDHELPAKDDEISTRNKPVSHEEFNAMKGDLKFVMEELKKVKEENSRLKAVGLK